MSILTETIKQWSELCAPRPLVVLFDEVDTLEGPALISFMRQLRGAFASRGVGGFAVSAALVGMRDLRDYLAESKGRIPSNPGSPFNVKEDSVTLSNLSREDVGALLSQHTEETGQVFEPEAVEAIWYWTAGQPYFVNALAKECVWTLTGEDYTRPITGPMILEAKEQLNQKHGNTKTDSVRKSKGQRTKQTTCPDPDSRRVNYRCRANLPQ